MLENLIAFFLGISVFAGIYLAVSAIVWWLWCMVLAYVWPTGPEQIINPNFWIFSATFLLFSILFGGLSNGGK